MSGTVFTFIRLEIPCLIIYGAVLLRLYRSARKWKQMKKSPPFFGQHKNYQVQNKIRMATALELQCGNAHSAIGKYFHIF